ncbi:MAG: DsrE family protein [Bacteroidales bacterium]
MKPKFLLIILISILTFTNSKIIAQSETPNESADKLVVVWTSDDPYVAERVALMYTHAAKTAGWFNEVTLIIWGPSAKLVSENLKIQEKLKAMQKDGVEIQACIVCATAYGVVDELKNLNFEVKGMGKPLSDYLKSGAKVLTF